MRFVKIHHFRREIKWKQCFVLLQISVELNICKITSFAVLENNVVQGIINVVCHCLLNFKINTLIFKSIIFPDIKQLYPKPGGFPFSRGAVNSLPFKMKGPTVLEKIRDFICLQCHAIGRQINWKWYFMRLKAKNHYRKHEMEGK